MATPFQQFVACWGTCTKCPLHLARRNIVLARGKLPCDVLVIGEAPGVSEDELGKPFCGPAGHLLDYILSRSIPREVRVAMTNLVCCIPLDPEEGVKTAEPEEEDIRACSPRLRDFVTLASPKLIVAVGGLARDWLDLKNLKNIWREPARRKLGERRILRDDPALNLPPIVDIIHPAAILRNNEAARGLQIQRNIITIQNAMEEIGANP